MKMTNYAILFVLSYTQAEITTTKKDKNVQTA